MNKKGIKRMIKNVNESELLNVKFNFVEEIQFFFIEMIHEDEIKRISVADFITFYVALDQIHKL